ncbi:hypothetical protein Smp_158900 [Schistosoma mansoni]|uniref:hypothetical protein n=1 Tax=Schistosoma mansoni TaxID=6183 RepID=UPI0001A62BC8|nr:hypothetical protein Smp_158900 [Schistosoma mansoni]|eukprot:XP_018651625.1 hypothetical protein Smp_158900 [Schistosoma mansoni]
MVNPLHRNPIKTRMSFQLILPFLVLLTDHIHATKKFKHSESNEESNENHDKRKQVDAHVQAFLKAVLDHAHGGTVRQTNNPNKKDKSVIKKDAFTQTDEQNDFDFESCSYNPDQSVSEYMGCNKNEQSSRVPNREMYSEEALNLLSQQSFYSEEAQNDLSLNDNSIHCYSTQGETGLLNHGVSNKGTRISSNKIKRAIDEWVKKYEDWFFQNFGMDVRTASHSIESKPETELKQSSESIIGAQTLFNTNSSDSQMLNPCVVSHAPVSYFIPEGSLCTIDGRFSPYYSLVPSFYLSPTLNNAPLGLHSNMTAFNFGVGVSLYPNHTFIPTTINTTMPNAVVSYSSNFANQLGASTVSFPPNVTSTTTTCNTTSFHVGTSFPIPPTIQQNHSITSFADLPSELQTSAMLATLALPVADSQHSLGQWGPHLKYGTYGRLPSPLDLQAFDSQRKLSEFGQNQANQLSYSSPDMSNISPTPNKSVKMPPPPPTFILLRRQAMVCALQISNTEKAFDIKQLIACDLLIGDVLIAESLSASKSLAQICTARQAFQILSRPCFLVGSVRQWEEVEYLVLCLSPKAEIVPKLSPFLKDPFESNFEKDSEFEGDESITTVFTPKPFDDMWIYLARLPKEKLYDQVHLERILAQSAEFSQMLISFEFEVQTTTGQIICNTLIDNQRCLSVESPDLHDAQQSAMSSLLNKLCATQPVVGLIFSREEEFEDDTTSSLWGIPEHVMVENLMWGKEELDSPIHFEQLEAHCEIPTLSPTHLNCDGADTNNNYNGINCTNRFSSSIIIESYLQAYAASALVSPICIFPTVVPNSLWPVVQQHARRWGLLSRVEVKRSSDPSSCLIVCKRVPLSRLKRSLYDQQQYGCFYLIDKGDLTTEALKRLYQADPLCFSENGSTTPNDNVQSSDHMTNSNLLSSSPPTYFRTSDEYNDEPVTRYAREFLSTYKTRIKKESNEDNCNLINDDCVLVTAELNQPSNAIEILDDLPKTLIPGIDF